MSVCSLATVPGSIPDADTSSEDANNRTIRSFVDPDQARESAFSSEGHRALPPGGFQKGLRSHDSIRQPRFPPDTHWEFLPKPSDKDTQLFVRVPEEG